MKLLLLVLILTASNIAHSKLLQIIHTNDLHSYFKGHQDGSGGYAKLKTAIDSIKANAASQGIETLQVDAGDFGEGTSFFLSNEGIDTFQALDKLGVEVSVVGNHDYMLGGEVLGSQIRESKIKAKIISANLRTTDAMNIGDTIKPYFDTERAGISIRVIGLSTPSIHFQYPLRPQAGSVEPFLGVAYQQSKKAKQENKELVIALTHLGIKDDKILAKRTRNIDLIIGGHDHLALEKEIIINNANGVPIPIVQAGSNSRYVGSLLIDIQPNQPVRVVEYKLIPINGDIPEDVGLKIFVEHAYENLARFFDRDLDEIIGTSTITLSGSINGDVTLTPSCWGKHLAKMQKESAQADIGLHLANFEGMQIPPGDIKFIDMINNFPHLSSYDDDGWQISTFSLKGKSIKWLLIVLANNPFTTGLSKYGITYKKFKIPKRIPLIGGKTFIWRLRINGNKVSKNKFYSFAMPTEVAETIVSLIPKKLRKRIPPFKPSGKYYWPELEKYFKINSPISCL